MMEKSQRLVMLRHMATLCAILMLVIISVSAYIRLGNAGLSCADWPQCYGSKLRQAQQGIDTKASETPAIAAIRVVHRVVASATLVLIIIMVMTCFAYRPILWREGWMTLLLLALVLFLAVLGRWSGGARVPAVNIGNLLGGFTLLALCWRLRQRVSGTLQSQDNFQLQLFAWLAVVVLLGQIALGGLVSAGFAGLSCPGLPGCGGGVSMPITLEVFNPWHEPVFASTLAPPANPAGAILHMAHRYGAIAIMVVIVLLSLSAIRSGRQREGLLLLGLLVIEIGLGLELIIMSLPLGIALAHNLVAALLLVVAFRLVWVQPKV